MNKVILPIGISGSGKTKWIKSLKDDFFIVSPDEMRVEFTENMDDKSMDIEIYEEVKIRTIEAIINGFDVIIDSTNLRTDRRRNFINSILVNCHKVTIYYKIFICDGNLSKQRIKKQIENGEYRANVSDSTIDRHVLLYEKMLKDIKEETHILL